MGTKRLVACLITAVMAFGAFAAAATTALASGHSASIGHVLTYNAAIDSSPTLQAPDNTWHDG